MVYFNMISTFSMQSSSNVIFFVIYFSCIFAPCYQDYPFSGALGAFTSQWRDLICPKSQDGCPSLYTTLHTLILTLCVALSFSSCSHSISFEALPSIVLPPLHYSSLLCPPILLLTAYSILGQLPHVAPVLLLSAACLLGSYSVAGPLDWRLLPLLARATAGEGAAWPGRQGHGA